MRRNYQKPVMNEVKIQQTSMICSTTTSVNSNAGLTYGGAGSVDARAKSRNADWDEWE